MKNSFEPTDLVPKARSLLARSMTLLASFSLLLWPAALVLFFLIFAGKGPNPETSRRLFIFFLGTPFICFFLIPSTRCLWEKTTETLWREERILGLISWKTELFRTDALQYLQEEACGRTRSLQAYLMDESCLNLHEGRDGRGPLVADLGNRWSQKLGVPFRAAENTITSTLSAAGPKPSTQRIFEFDSFRETVAMFFIILSWTFTLFSLALCFLEPAIGLVLFVTFAILIPATEALRSGIRDYFVAELESGEFFLIRRTFFWERKQPIGELSQMEGIAVSAVRNHSNKSKEDAFFYVLTMITKEASVYEISVPAKQFSEAVEAAEKAGKALNLPFYIGERGQSVRATTSPSGALIEFVPFNHFREGFKIFLLIVPGLLGIGLFLVLAFLSAVYFGRPFGHWVVQIFSLTPNPGP